MKMKDMEGRAVEGQEEVLEGLVKHWGELGKREVKINIQDRR